MTYSIDQVRVLLGQVIINTEADILQRIKHHPDQRAVLLSCLDTLPEVLKQLNITMETLKNERPGTTGGK